MQLQFLTLLLPLPLLACHAASGEPETKPARPNIVYILADDLGYGDISALNPNAAWKTPQLDGLAKQGMSFSDAHSGSAVCTPTRYGILTGRYAWRTHLASSVLWGESPPLIDAERVTIGGWLQEQGYRTACFGKWHLGWDWARDAANNGEIDFSGPVENGPHARGFDESFCHAGSLDMEPYVWVQDGGVTALPDRITENRDGNRFWRRGPTAPDFEHEQVLPELTRRAVEFLGRQAESDEPFFLYLPLSAPHTPVLPIERFRGASGTNSYGDFVLQIDDSVGQVLAALEEHGLAQDTLVIFTSDNGCSPEANFKELAAFGHDPNFGFRGHKADIFEGGHRVPFVVRWPGRVEAGTKSEEPICLTDLMATCAEVLGQGLPAGAGPDSVSFLPALEGSAMDGGREALIHHSINGSFAVRHENWKLILCPGSGGWSDPQPSEAQRLGLPALQLYDLESDLAETRNLAADNPEICKRLIAILTDYVDRGRSTPGADLPNDRQVSFLPAD